MEEPQLKSPRKRRSNPKPKFGANTVAGNSNVAWTSSLATKANGGKESKVTDTASTPMVKDSVLRAAGRKIEWAC